MVEYNILNCQWKLKTSTWGAVVADSCKESLVSHLIFISYFFKVVVISSSNLFIWTIYSARHKYYHMM